MDYTHARQHMVVGQLTPNKVTLKPLLKHMSEMPREVFVSGQSKTTAYTDTPTSVGYDREMFSPLVCARLLQALDIQSGEKMLVVASGTGYSAALASRLGAQVCMVEGNRNLCDRSRRMLADQKCVVEIQNANPATGMAAEAPYRKILIDAPVGEVPSKILGQLEDGGLLGAVVNKNGVMVATIFRKVKKTLFEEHLLETTGNVLEDFKQEEKFVF